MAMNADCLLTPAPFQIFDMLTYIEYSEYSKSIKMMRKDTLNRILRSILGWSTSAVFAVSGSTNYLLQDYSIGSGDDGQSSNYALEIGEAGDGNTTGLNYELLGGLIGTLQIEPPQAPTVSNDGSEYRRLRVTIVPRSSYPSDTEYLIAISDDSFATTDYVQSDLSIAASFGDEDWQTYAAWGGASGSLVLGLTPNTSYQVKVAARHGTFANTDFSETASATTLTPSFAFDIDVAATDTETSAPFSIDFGELNPGSAATASSKLWLDLATNATNGASIWIKSTTGSLTSQSTGGSIATVTGDLTSLTSGFGAQVATITQASGGPLAKVSPYDGAGDVVGNLLTTPLEIVRVGQQVTGGRISIVMKAKVASTTEAAIDYRETMTVMAAGIF